MLAVVATARSNGRPQLTSGPGPAMPSRLVGAAPPPTTSPTSSPPTTAAAAGIAHLAWVEGACRVRVSVGTRPPDEESDDRQGGDEQSG